MEEAEFWRNPEELIVGRASLSFSLDQSQSFLDDYGF